MRPPSRTAVLAFWTAVVALLLSLFAIASTFVLLERLTDLEGYVARTVPLVGPEQP